MSPKHSHLIRTYFSQGERYLSESQDEMIQIKDMHPAHAANAAARLLADAKTWADEAAMTGAPARFVIQTHLFKALVARASGEQVKPPQIEPAKLIHVCFGCSYQTTRLNRMIEHARMARHAWN